MKYGLSLKSETFFKNPTLLFNRHQTVLEITFFRGLFPWTFCSFEWTFEHFVDLMNIWTFCSFEWTFEQFVQWNNWKDYLIWYIRTYSNRNLHFAVFWNVERDFWRRLKSELDSVLFSSVFYLWWMDDVYIHTTILSQKSREKKKMQRKAFWNFIR